MHHNTVKAAPSVAFGLGIRVLLLALTAALSTASAVDVSAAGGAVDLGRPTNDLPTSSGLLLDGFKRGGPQLRAGKLPELLYISALNDRVTAVDRWPIVKALQEFGTFTNIRPAATNPGLLGSVGMSIPTFDLSRATYRSKFVAFIHKDVLDADNHPFQKLSGVEQQLYARYVRAKNHFGPRDPDHFLGTLEDAFGSGSHQFPFLAIGGYLGTGPLGVSDLDFQLIQSTPGPTSPATQYASFAEAQQSLATGQPVGGLQLYMIQDVNTTTNVLVALICHADHSRPRSACGRSAIKKLLKRIK